MSMLSRVADRLYWMARYLERAENTARLCGAYSHLILDMPKGTLLGWDTLIRIIDGEQAFAGRYKNDSERNVLKFMIADQDNQGSIRFSVRAARENVRTTRDVLPEELWELINELHLYVAEWVDRSVARKVRFELLEEVVMRSQRINGLVESAVSRDHVYSFLKMGRLIERADMTSRIVDVATAAILNHDSEEVPDLTLLWTTLLKSLSANSAYRRDTGPLVEANDVVNFLFCNEHFPRSILFALRGIDEVLKGLRNQQRVSARLAAVIEEMTRFDAQQMTLADLHRFIDLLQEKIIGLNQQIDETWFALHPR